MFKNLEKLDRIDGRMLKNLSYLSLALFACRLSFSLSAFALGSRSQSSPSSALEQLHKCAKTKIVFIISLLVSL